MLDEALSKRNTIDGLSINVHPEFPLIFGQKRLLWWVGVDFPPTAFVHLVVVEGTQDISQMDWSIGLAKLCDEEGVFVDGRIVAVAGAHDQEEVYAEEEAYFSLSAHRVLIIFRRSVVILHL